MRRCTPRLDSPPQRLIGLILLSLIGYKPHDVQEARSAKIISGIDTFVSIFAIPSILVAQGVLTYYWATI